MTEPTRQRRTAASILEGIRGRLEHERIMLQQAQDEEVKLRTRIVTLESVLKDAEKNGESE